MELSTVFWILAAVIAGGVLIALAVASRRKGLDRQNPGDTTQIYTSGVFSLIRKSPRETVLAKVPDLEKIRLALASNAQAQAEAEAYREQWLKVANLCINTVEHGDKEGIQTYRFVVPEKCRSICGQFGGDAYVTREQLHHQAQLIPPFHLGCGCELAPREAWQGGSGGWSPILPVNGQYHTPDWRTVVPL